MLLPLHKSFTDEAVVFVVDDDASVRVSLQRLIHAAGWKVESYASAQELFDRQPSEANGCIVLDLQMPGLDGLHAYERMQGFGCHLPVIFLTGYGDVPSSVAAMKQGAIDFLQKPVDDNVLLQTIDRAMAHQVATRKADALKATAERKLASLSRRERDVLHGVLLGKLNKQIAADLGIAEKTVKVHRGRVMLKTGARTIAGLMLICADAGVHAPHN